MKANIDVVFTGGIGHLNAKLMRGKLVTATGSISLSGTIPFADVQSNDVISIDGVCTGSAKVTVDIPTDPATPITYPEGNIFDGYIVS